MDLKKKIEKKDIVVAVVGLGYVGLPLAMTMTQKGIKVIGIDLDKKKLSLLAKGKNYIKDVKDEELKRSVDKKLFTATDNFSKISEVDVICITVPTPITKDKTPDLTYVKSAAESISKYLKKNQLVILKSTTYPGTTKEVVGPILEKSKLKLGEDFYLAFAPERIDPGNKKYNTANTPKVVGGVTKESTILAAKFFELFINKVHKVSSAEVAEMTKILENTFRLINISFINEMALIASKLGINIWEVIEAANTKPFGFMPFYPGPGLGGHCIPVDPYYLSYRAKEYNLMTRFIDLSSDIDDYMSSHVVDLIKSSSNTDKPQVLILGVAYKKDIDDFRESPSVKVMEKLDKAGIKYDFYDPFIDTVVEGKFVKKGLKNLSEKIVSKYDVVAILTDHSNIDYKMILRSARMIVDTRNAIKAKNKKVVKI